MGKASTIPERPILSRRCYLCGKHYVLGHPKDYKPFCDECLKKIAKMIGVSTSD